MVKKDKSNKTKKKKWETPKLVKLEKGDVASSTPAIQGDAKPKE
jgi:hypothetical protein